MSASYRRNSSAPVLRSPSSPPSSYSSSSFATTSFHRSTSSTSVAGEAVKRHNQRKKRTCMCSPSTHPGSFRCRLHKNSTSSKTSTSNRHNVRRSAMANSLVRISRLEGELVKRALEALIRRCSYNQRRRCNFQPRPSRFSVMSKVEEVA
ncbi:hypothetical protein MtrunA17_Chr2g0304571 [Medicago truncatula]|uniref:Serine-rich protein-like protein n=1 Tax=Medicago truncatula TaxID=3880 RepID=A0A072V7X3_MEDTR|nr:uncharacterized protein LOC25488330 [Medicago truncatula]KEH37892.1 hypothetical protein MTR_2g450700 [Medicago truncatula]RHN73978.1 hypothetical protein MtrunA17_Chr2g0304571 [Medicago truncatula]